MPLSPILIRAVGQFLEDLVTFRDLMQIRSNAMLATVSFRIVEMTLEGLVRTHGDIVDIKSRPGVGDYMRRLYGDATIDIATNLTAVQDAVASAALTLRNVMPKDASGWVLAYQLNSDPAATEQFIWRQVTPAQSAGLRTNLDAIVTAIDAFFSDLTA